jgi:hypothetical protein
MARKYARLAWLAAVLTAFPFLCPAQTIPLVPAADWRQVNSTRIPIAQVDKYDGDPKIEREYGVNSIELRTYQMGQGSKTRANVLVELASDPIDAYGLLTFYQTPEMTPEKGLELAVGDSNQVLMARGNNFIRFERGSSSTLSENDFQALLIFVGGTREPKSVDETLPAAMPPKGLVAGSEKYVVGLEAARRLLPVFRTDLIGFDQGAELQLGRYKTDKGESTVMSISYPTPQMARLRFGSLSHFLALNEDHGGDSIYGKRQHTYVFLILNSGNAATASSLLNQFQIESSVSWDRPPNPQRTFTLQVVHMILAILILTGYLIGACVVAGLAFFLSKRIALKYFPDSSWGHTDDDQLIRLNLKF